jgi:large subunit ribosomal protein L10
MPKFEKDLMTSELKGYFEKNPYVFFTSITGLKVADVTELRRSLEGKGEKALLVKNTLAERILKERGLNGEAKALLKDSVLLTFANKNPQDVSKAIVEFTKAKEKCVLRGAILDGKVVEPAVIKQLATLPSREVLLGKVVSGMNAPIAGLVLTLGGLVRAFAVVLNQVAEKKQK